MTAEISAAFRCAANTAGGRLLNTGGDYGIRAESMHATASLISAIKELRDYIRPPRLERKGTIATMTGDETENGAEYR